MLRTVFLCGGLAALLLTAPANAADLPATPARAPVVAPDRIFTWTGIYFGGHGGGLWADETSTIIDAAGLAAPGTQIKSSPSGWLGGGQVGGNFQYGQWVFGVEGDASWASSSQTVDTVFGLATARGTSDINWFATLTGRFGYAAGNVLFYAKGGAAWMDVDYTASVLLTGTNALIAGPVTIKDTRQGWTVGGGIEFGFWHNWSARVEYDYLDFGSRRYVFTLGGIPNTIDIDSKVHLVKAGINYRFNWSGGPY